MKKCGSCGIERPSNCFSPDKRTKDGLQYRCKECWKEYRKKNKARIDATSKACKEAKPEHYRNLELKRNYSITLDQYNSILEKQGGVCAICGTDDPSKNAGKKINNFVVDHDHNCCPGRKSCGECVRGLLCLPCNFGIGSLQDSIDSLEKAITYLREFQSDS